MKTAIAVLICSLFMTSRLQARLVITKGDFSFAFGVDKVNLDIRFDSIRDQSKYTLTPFDKQHLTDKLTVTFNKYSVGFQLNNATDAAYTMVIIPYELKAGGLVHAFPPATAVLSGTVKFINNQSGNAALEMAFDNITTNEKGRGKDAYQSRMAAVFSQLARLIAYNKDYIKHTDYPYWASNKKAVRDGSSNKQMHLLYSKYHTRKGALYTISGGTLMGTGLLVCLFNTVLHMDPGTAGHRTQAEMDAARRAINRTYIIGGAMIAAGTPLFTIGRIHLRKGRQNLNLSFNLRAANNYVQNACMPFRPQIGLGLHF
jgi:hypothetical protein